MAKFIKNAPSIESIDTEIKVRKEKYEDLHLSIKTSDNKVSKYTIHSDERFKVRDIEDKISKKASDEDLEISEYSERSYLFITIGKETIQVTGRKS